MQSAVSAHHSVHILGVWFTLTAIFTACYSLASLYKAIKLFTLISFQLDSTCLLYYRLIQHYILQYFTIKYNTIYFTGLMVYHVIYSLYIYVYQNVY